MKKNMNVKLWYVAEGREGVRPETSLCRTKRALCWSGTNLFFLKPTERGGRKGMSPRPEGMQSSIRKMVRAVINCTQTQRLDTNES